jgi:TfoX/Sxy family transcriptional regulator of competence genes
MAYDEALAERVQERLDKTDGITEKRMFGGLAFLTHGNMAVGVNGDDLIVRIDPDATAAALARPGARLFDMTGRPMKGWIVVDGSTLDDDALDSWIAQGTAYAGALPHK